jgi:bla regulator protein blaR1
MRIVAVGMLWFCMAGYVYSQPSATQATFEVASVKPSEPSVLGLFTHFLPGGGLQITGATIKDLVAIAYNVRVFQISGGPAWIGTERFNVDSRPVDARAATLVATAPGDPPKVNDGKTGERLRNLLADRFQLAIHRETGEQPVYELVIAKGGAKLQESMEGNNLIRKGIGTLKGESVGLKMLALNLSNELNRPVIDKTGLAGNYDFELKWTPLLSAAPVDPPLPTDPDRPSIFAALAGAARSAPRIEEGSR